MAIVVSLSAKQAYNVFKKGKKAYSYYKLVKETLDVDTRSGASLKLGVKLAADITGKILGRSITLHPYFTYHKAHIAALADALNASSNYDRAIEAFNKAVSAADSSATLTDNIREYASRTTLFAAQYFFFVEVLRLSREVSSPQTYSAAAREMAEAGLSNNQLQQSESDLDAWRANWAGLYMDVLELLTMVDIEYRTASEAYAKFNKTIETLKHGSNMARIAGYAAEEKRQWEIYDRMTNPTSGKREQAVTDPSAFANTQRDRVDNVARALAEMCDLVMSDEVRDRDTFYRALAILKRRIGF